LTEEAKKYFPHLLEALPETGDATLQTLELLWRAAPEQTDELDGLFAAGIQARIANGQKPEMGVTYNVLQIPKGVLEQIWLLSHAAWHDLVQFDKLKSDPTAEIERHLVADAIAASKGLARNDRSGWPPSIPALGEKREGVENKAIRELHAMATAWAITHEMRHAKFFEASDRPKTLIEEELQCDAYAAEFLFSRIERYVELTGEPIDKVR